MKFIFSIPLLLTVLIGGNAALALQPESEHKINISGNVALEKQEDQPASSTDPISTDSASTERGAIFARMIYNLMVTDTRVFESDFSLIANSAGLSIDVDVQIQTVFEQSNRFQSRIQFVDFSGVAGSYYSITSDGQQVWVYDSSQNIYSVMTYQEFSDDYDDGFLTGLFTGFLLEVLEDPEDIAAIANISEEEILQDEAILREIASAPAIKNAIIGTELIDGVLYTTVTYDEPQDGFIMTLFIDPETSLIEDIHVASQESGLDIVMTENLTHTDLPDFTSQTPFTFLPPEDAQLSETPISIDPF